MRLLFPGIERLPLVQHTVHLLWDDPLPVHRERDARHTRRDPVRHGGRVRVRLDQDALAWVEQERGHLGPTVRVALVEENGGVAVGRAEEPFSKVLCEFDQGGQAGAIAWEAE